MMLDLIDKVWNSHNNGLSPRMVTASNTSSEHNSTGFQATETLHTILESSEQGEYFMFYYSYL